MANDLLHPTGPESNNERAAAFEDQLSKMGETLGWSEVCRNVDFFIKNSSEVYAPRGVDILWSVRDPIEGDLKGILGEAKVHGQQASRATIEKEIETLHDKMLGLRDSARWRDNEHLVTNVEMLDLGLIAHRTEGFDPVQMQAALQDTEQTNRQIGDSVPSIFFVGPDTLESLADCLTLYPASEFFWPPTEHADGQWAPAAPPLQLVAGMVAYRTSDGSEILWLMDTLTDHDIPALADIVFRWGINPFAVVGSLLSPDRWRTVQSQWTQHHERTNKRGVGVLPERAVARNLSFSRMNRFDELWPAT